MFFPADSTTEIIAHFLGYFEVRLEEARLHWTYEEFTAELEPEAADRALLQIAAQINQRLALGEYLPSVRYTPPSWELQGDGPIEPWAMYLPYVDIPALPGTPHFGGWPEGGVGEGPDSPAHGPVRGIEPGEVIAIIAQKIALSDNDVVILGTYDGPVVFQSGADTALSAMHAAAMTIGAPVTGTSALHAPSDVPVFVEQTAAVIHALKAAPDAPGTSIVATDAIEGTYVNGVLGAEHPDLAEALPEHLREAVEEDEPEFIDYVAVTITVDDVVDSVVLNAGGNLMVNEAGFLNAGMVSTFLAIAGDYHQLDAIIQTNALFDTDTVPLGFPGSASNFASSSHAYNLAVFEQKVLDSAAGPAEANPGAMPLNWQFSVVTGDVVFIEWLTQFSFMSDQDVHVLTSTGTTTTVTTGENVGLNSVSFANIGFHYDLIIIGGSLYDANIIVQTNVLYDNDTLEMLLGAQGEGTLSTSGNLLWNQATILNVGATEFQTGIPSHYEEAAQRLGDGNYNMPAGFKTDSEFSGFQAIKVLYIAGDVYDIRYVEQTNVMGDADYVAIEQAQVMGSQPDTDWEVSTGANALINIATITDYDSVGGTAYVGGDIYSDAILIQADIIAADPENPGSDALVTEVIAFLETDGDASVDVDGPIVPDHTPADGPSVDVMQSMLA